jgi:hypothetical protein
MATASSIIAAGVDTDDLNEQFAIKQTEFIDEIDSNIAGNEFNGDDGVAVYGSEMSYLVVAGASLDEDRTPTVAAFFIESTRSGTIERVAATVVDVPECKVDVPALERTEVVDPVAMPFSCNGDVRGVLNATTASVEMGGE